jgi:trans-2,3-dihydro-3-hydroxyanthranilate isomerase
LQRRYALLDVFTDRPLAGNQLAVVYDADGLDAGLMQAIAAEFRLSETVFCITPENAVHAARLRIFTPGRELPFAGHPTIGCAVALGLAKAEALEKPAELMVVLEEEVGPIRCGVSIANERSGRAVFDAPLKPEALPFASSRADIAAAIGVTPNEIGFENHLPSAFDAGLPYAFVPVRDLSVIGKVQVNPARWTAAFPAPASAAFVYCRESVSSSSQFHARMFAPEIGIAEDPATGSAAAAFPGVILRFDEPPAGTHQYVIEEGFEMGRPSHIGVEVDVAGNGIAGVRISGHAVLIAEGVLSLDD